VVFAQHPPLVGQQLLEQLQRRASISGLPSPVCDVVTGGQHVAVIGTQHLPLIGQQLLEQPQRPVSIPPVPGSDRDVGAGDQLLMLTHAPSLPDVPLRIYSKQTKDQRAQSAAVGRRLSRS
jgi:hypothetical protein